MTDIGDFMSVSFVRSQLNNTEGVSQVRHTKTNTDNHVFEVDFEAPLTDDEVEERFEYPFEQYDAEYRYEGDEVETWESLTLTIKNDLV